MEHKKLRVAVVGAGGIANGVHLPALCEIGIAHLVAICDITEERAHIAADKYAIPGVYTSLKEMLEQERPDALFVLVEPDAIFRVALTSIQLGVATFLEKPPGITVHQTESLLRAARKNGATVAVGFNRRFIPLVTEVLRRMRTLGSIHQVDGWFFKHGEGIFYDGCSSAFTCDAIHTLDLLRYIARGNDCEIDARRAHMITSRFGNSPMENAWNALVEFSNGVIATLHSNYKTGGRVHGVAIHTSAASAYVDLGFGGAGCSARILYAGEDMYSLAAQGSSEVRVEIFDGLEVASSQEYHRYYGYFAEDEAFLRAVLEKRSALCSLEDALGTMRLSETLEREAMR